MNGSDDRRPPGFTISGRQQVRMLVAVWLLLPALVLLFYLLQVETGEKARFGVGTAQHGLEQRTLAMQVGIQAMRLAGATTPGKRSAIRRTLRVQLTQLEMSAGELLYGGADSGAASDLAHPGPGGRLSIVLTGFVDATRALLELPDAELKPEHPLLLEIQHALDGELIGRFETELEHFRRVAERDVAGYQKREVIVSIAGTALFALFLVFITAEAFQRQQAETRLRKSEQRYRDLVEGSIQGVLVHRGRAPLFANQAFADIFGFSTPAEVLALPDLAALLFPQDWRPMLRSYVLARKAGFAAVQSPGQRRDGEAIWGEAVIRQVLWDGQPANQVTVFNITQRRQAEEDRAMLAAAMAQSGDAVFITDVEGIIRYVNRGFERLTGYTRQEVIGKSPAFLEPDARQGRLFTPLLKKLREGGIWKGRYPNRRKDGSTYEAEATHSPVRDTAGKVTHFICVQKDVTRQIELEERLRRAQRMEAIGNLAGGIAHDFNNMLVPIIGYAELLAGRKQPDDPEYQDLLQVLKAATRAKELIAQIMLFSRRAESARSATDLHPIADEALRLLRATLPASIRIEEQVEDNLRTVIANSGQINQVLLNLCVNAGQAMPNGGRLEVSLENVTLERHKIYMGEVISGAFVRLRVKDSGTGMDAETMRHIFEPFFTTKEKGTGTGLGLATVFGIVAQHEGHVDVASAPGEGATFDIYLPVTREVVPGQVLAVREVETGQESILYVDDEEAVSEVSKRLLERLGYHVTAMTDSVAALHAFRENPGRFDMVITDQNMPGLTGRDLALEIHAVRGDIPIVLCTGYSEQVTPEVARECGIAEYVVKPVTSDELAGLVRKVLDGAHGPPPGTPLI